MPWYTEQGRREETVIDTFVVASIAAHSATEDGHLVYFSTGS
ncbi:MAG TPA: hypothetical protein PKW37_05070 [Salinivirgaceae bacterium]|nr:hypothetical protein [Salinivirgaceae bacterium]